MPKPKSKPAPVVPKPASTPASGRRLGTTPASTLPKPPAKPVNKPAAPKPTLETKANNNAALEKLKNLWGTKSGDKSGVKAESKQGSMFSGWKKPSAAAQARASRAQEVKEMAQLKRDAKGDAKIELINRRYLTIQSAATSKTAPVYYRKDIITGKLLDLSAEVLNINLKTQQTSEGRIALYHERTKQYMPYNEKLSATLGGTVRDGDKVSWDYDEAATDH